MMYWYGEGMNGWGYALMTISMILFWALVIAGGVAFIRYVSRPIQAGDAHAPRPTSGQILAERFARGEIDPQEYRERLQTLQANDQSLPKF
jgi:putative membrane protein